MPGAELTVIACQVLDIGPSWSANTGVISPFWRLYCNLDPGASVTMAGHRHQFAAGRLYLIPSWQRFDCHCDRPVRHAYAHLDPHWPAAAVHGRWTAPWSPPPRDPLHVLARGLHQTGGEVRQRLSAACAQGACAALLRAAGIETLAEPPPRLLRPALALIEAGLAGPLPLERLARACDCGVDHLRRRFRDLLGLPPAAWIRQRRCLRAAELLLAGELDIETIAERCGFANRYHFSRVFRSVLRCSPGAFRRTG